jgi:hypothetical protein
MSTARFGVQILIVLTLMVVMNWPELGRVRAISVWRHAAQPSASEGGKQSGSASSRASRGEFGFGSAVYTPSPGSMGGSFRRRLEEDTVETRRRRPTPARVLALGGTLNGIIGVARTAENAPISGARLVLRNLTTGLVEARATADGSGEFVFLDLFPSGYVVELLGSRGDVVGTSASLTIDIGDLIETTVRAPGEGRLEAMFGPVQPTAHDAVSAASRNGVTQVTAPERCVSPPCGR